MSEININEVEKLIEKCIDLNALEDVRLDYLGRSGKITLQLKALSSLDKQEKAVQGKALNVIKGQFFQAIKKKQSELELAQQKKDLLADGCDVSLPGYRNSWSGGIHPVMKTQIKLESIFKQLGFDVAKEHSNQEVESEYYNFSALNIPKFHPARAMHDTFYLKSGGLLRTHTSPAQIKILEKNKEWPLRVITSGKVFRCDSDQTHTPMFHQMEGLVVDAESSFANLKWLIQNVLNSFFEQEVKLRFRASFFPFTEPSAEVDIRWPLVGEGEHKWLEVLGCGMVHPNVLKACKVNHDLYQGYAFGFGLDRLAMLKYNVTDLRDFFVGDLSFLEQFN